MVINVGAFADSEEIRKDLNRWADIRARALDICYQMPGYKDLPLEEKNKVYEKVKAEVERRQGNV